MLRKLWLGLFPLPVAFWIFYLLGGVIVFFALAVVTGVLGVSFQNLRAFLFLFGLIVIWAYWFIASVGAWRSADNWQGKPLWAYGAKVIIAAVTLDFIFRLIDGGAATIAARVMGDWD